MDQKNNFEFLYHKIDTLDMKLDAIDKTLLKQELNLREHMKRSDQLEILIGSVNVDMKPLQKHVAMVEGGLKLIGIVSLCVGIVLGIAQLVRMF